MRGIHHLGLAVSKLDKSRDFFCDLLGYQEVRRIPDYPAMFTLWQTSVDANAFDRHQNVGLHHTALEVESEQELLRLYHKLSNSPDIDIEFGPECLRTGPAKHIICREPSGIRIEFIWLAEQAQ